MGVAAVIVSTLALGHSVYQGQEQKKEAKNAAKAQKESQVAQSRISEVEAQKARIAQVREARIRRATVLSNTNVGGEGTSGVAGAVGSITSQEQANIGLSSQIQDFASMASAANQRAADATSRSQIAQIRGQQGMALNTIFGADKEDFKTIFGSKIK